MFPTFDDRDRFESSVPPTVAGATRTARTGARVEEPMGVVRGQGPGGP
jgi:hypothetical protein